MGIYHTHRGLLGVGKTDFGGGIARVSTAAQEIQRRAPAPRGKSGGLRGTGTWSGQKVMGDEGGGKSWRVSDLVRINFLLQGARGSSSGHPEESQSQVVTKNKSWVSEVRNTITSFLTTTSSWLFAYPRS
mmetsp:Transcript_25478/g.40234  ORF Transcript_25478/g.40234 Transcript_25478/m.40234 type:complete len:130 (+) Transcript_25478:233-622(+)